MRHAPSYLLAILVAAGISGCGPQIGDSADPVTAILDAVSTPTDSQTSSASTPPADSNDQNDNSSSAPPDVTRTFTGFVNGVGEYELLSLGPGNMGDKWVITPTSPFDGPFVVVLFDADQNLLMRSYMSYNNVMHHTLRADADEVYLGIMPSYATGRGGTFGLRTRVQSGQAVPTPRRQIVYLNFAGGTNVQVHTRAAMSFGPFDGVLVGDAYAEHTEEMKAVILAEMCADYADFDIAFHTSDDGPPPDSPYSTVHFGGDEPGLLGLADSVDSYNHNLSQQAVVYVDNFAPYWTMRLQPDEMAVMIANVASHELGHLLGLYHTSDPDDLMDTTGSAWDLAGTQTFSRAQLEESVFVVGWEDCPALLNRTLGPQKSETAKSARRANALKGKVYSVIRDFTRQELSCTCGTCRALDGD